MLADVRQVDGMKIRKRMGNVLHNGRIFKLATSGQTERNEGRRTVSGENRKSFIDEIEGGKF